MTKKSPSEMRKAQIQKTAVTLIRLRYSLLADEEINNVLPDAMDDFDKALNNGELLQIESALELITKGT